MQGSEWNLAENFRIPGQMVHHPGASAQRLIHIHPLGCGHLLDCPILYQHSLEEGLQNIETHIKIFAPPLLDFGYGLPFLQTTIYRTTIRGEYLFDLFLVSHVSHGMSKAAYADIVVWSRIIRIALLLGACSKENTSMMPHKFLPFSCLEILRDIIEFLTLEPIKECGVVSIGDLIGLSYTREAQQRYHKRAENKKKELELKNNAK